MHLHFQGLNFGVRPPFNAMQALTQTPIAPAAGYNLAFAAHPAFGSGSRAAFAPQSQRPCPPARVSLLLYNSIYSAQEGYNLTVTGW